MSTYILENNPETVKWLLSRNLKQSTGHTENPNSIIVWESINTFMVVRKEGISISTTPITLKEYQELEVLRALGITL